MLIKLIPFVMVLLEAIGQPCEDKNSVDVTDGQIYHDGTVVFGGVTYPKKYVYKKNDTDDRLFGCLCEVMNCFRKCCHIGFVMNVGKCTHIPAMDLMLNYGLNLSTGDAFVRNVGIQESGLGVVFGNERGKPCTKAYLKDSGAGGPRYLQTDGRLSVGEVGSWSSDQYCIDTFLYDVDGEKKPRLDALICYDENDDDHSYVTTSTCMLISCVFILATVAVYAWLPELRNLHGRVLMVYLLCVFVGFLCMATMQILLLQGEIDAYQCIGLTFVTYFFLESAFFWLNVMSFDIWWTFSGKRGIGQSLSIQARFWAYCTYAFGMPTLLTAIMAGLEFSGLPAHPLLPNIKQLGCFLHGKSRLLYLYGPIVVVCIANTTFFMLTAIKIAGIKKQTAVLNSRESSTHDPHRNDKQRLLLYVKLFLVMGVNWMLEVISAIYPEANYIWKFTDAYNVLTGLIIFIIFVCKKKIFRLIKKRFKQLRGDPMGRNPTVSSRTASSRDDVRMNSIYDTKNPSTEKPPKQP